MSESSITSNNPMPIPSTRQPKTPKKPKKIKPPNVIIPANIDWQTDDTGNKVPVSGEFGDVYFSHADGLAESRHVFLDSNHLPERLANLSPQQCFTIAELGFGTGLNLLALWQLWRQLRATHPHLSTARVHMITTEKHPIAREDLTQILTLWGQRAPELTELIEQLLAAYPPLIAGCHRLQFNNDNLTVDIWLGDAADSLARLDSETTIERPYIKRPYVDAWFLDGFAPSCNETLWAETIFAQIQRLSSAGTTAATYSCAGTVKRALQDSGFAIKKVKGFGRKREMLTAEMLEKTPSEEKISNNNTNYSAYPSTANKVKNSSVILEKPTHTVVIGAGVSGLLSAWSLANRGLQVTIVDKTAPLAGASGNPRALLAPNMTPIHHVYEHLHTIGYLYSSRFYRYLNEQAVINNTAPVFEPTGTLDLLVKTNIGPQQIADYPNEMATTLSAGQASHISGLEVKDLADNLYLPQSGLLNPQALKNIILAHPLITFRQLAVTQIDEMETHVCVAGYTAIISHKDDEHTNTTPITIQADNAIICAAYESHQLDARIIECRTIRGQLSWFTPTAEQRAKLPKIPLKYGGYCTPFIGQTGDAKLDDAKLDDAKLDDKKLNNIAEEQPQFLLGASFVDGDQDVDIRSEENQQNRDKLIEDIPELDKILPTDTHFWQARAGIRTQTLDYHPLVGLLADSQRLWALSAMGAKGYAIAPICAESLADMMLGCFTPLSAVMLARLSPNRARLHKPLA